MRGLRPVETTTVMSATAPASVRAYDALRLKIFSGEMPAGTLLSESKIALELGVSRTPLREAFHALLSDGLLEEGPNRQVQVTVYPPPAQAEVERLIDWLLRLVLAEAAERTDVQQGDLLRLVVIRIRRALRNRDRGGRLDGEYEFRLQLARAAQMPMLVEILNRLLGQMRLMVVASGESGRRDPRTSAADMLDAVIDALERGDATEAGVALHAYPFSSTFRGSGPA